jgi:acyl-homoserine-lactone acylase
MAMSVASKSVSFFALAVLCVVPFSTAAAYGGANSGAAPTETVTIRRDTYGVPHIFADTNEGVMYGFGYAQAQDHLLEMLTNYIRARGRLAEFFGVDDPGSPGSDTAYLDSDIQNRSAKVWDIAESGYSQADPVMRSEVEAFAAGVNRYIVDNGATLPPWVGFAAPVTGIDIVAFGRWTVMTAEYFVVNQELTGGMKQTWNSNEWVVGKTRSANGNVMVQIDPHVHWTIDCREYEAHLHGGDYNFLGATYYGFPAFALGHSDYFAMALTSNPVDTADVFIETLSTDLSSYLFDGQWYPVIDEPVTLKILGANPVTVPRRYTHGGERIIKKIDGVNKKAYSYRWVSMFQLDLFTQLMRGDKARNLTEFKQALSMLCGSKGNFAYGDRDGNVYYIYYACQPMKNETVDWTRPVDGSTSLNAWWGTLLPFNDLPQIENPASDYVINCNVAPWYVTEGSGINVKDYPCYLFRRRPDGSQGAGNTFRQIRATDLIVPNPAVTVAQMKEYIFDDFLVSAEWLKPLIEASIADPIARQYVNDPWNLIDPAGAILKKWDNRMGKNSSGGALFTLFYEALPQTLMAEERPRPQDMTLLERVKLLYLFETAALWLQTKHGAIDVPWGDVHKIRRGGQSYAVGGGSTKAQSLRIAGIDAIENGVTYCGHGSAYTMTVVLSDPVQSFSAKPYGQSEDPASSHFADLTRLYCDDVFKPVWFETADILANLESTTVLIYRH